MDFLAHGLWTAAAAKVAKNKIRIHAGWAAFWGVAPDLFAFTLPFTLFFWNIALGRMRFAGFPRPESNAASVSFFDADLTHVLYGLSHSLVVFLVVFGIVWVIFRRPLYELLGWLLHILIDIPTHSYKFYPTPFLWPISDLKINGHSWADPTFLIINYTALAAVYLFLFWFRKRIKNQQSRSPNSLS